ncbi:MAG: ABC transporter substrate-binding protein [Hydrogenophaga sp.]|uniref:ABC transporter substrate-binding protein n=1 Tax=Hydrogenophaga sp. TaxID=1904254 RepID=UPI001DA87242|nr:ABC transporter substrate-binding protein [Hydrogenophaga sp.]MBX3609325.1 ABC transporter substrate-binding protein [Hydrogenophaga sp.]
MHRRRIIEAFAGAALSPVANAMNQHTHRTLEPIVLGQTADFSSTRAAISRAYSEGAALGFAQANAEGGVQGRPIRIAQLDDGYDTDRAEANARHLVEKHHALALIHLVGTDVTARVLPFADRAGIALVHPITGADFLRPPARSSRQAFFLRASYGLEMDRIVAHLDALGIQRIAAFYEDEPCGHSVMAGMRASLACRGLSLQETCSLPPNQPTVDAVMPAVRALVSARPQAIIIGSAGPTVEKFIRAFLGAGGRSRLFGLSVTDASRMFRELGPLCAGITMAQVFPDVRSSVLPVVRDYRDAAIGHNVATSGFGLEGYISARLIVQALRAAGPLATREQFVQALEGITQVGGFQLASQNPREGSTYTDLATMGDDGRLMR